MQLLTIISLHFNRESLCWMFWQSIWELWWCERWRWKRSSGRKTNKETQYHLMPHVDCSEGWNLKVNSIISCDTAFVRLIGQCCQRTCRQVYGCGWSDCITNPYSDDELSLNTRSVLGMRMIGKCEESLHVVNAILDLPPGMKSSPNNKHLSRK